MKRTITALALVGTLALAGCATQGAGSVIEDREDAAAETSPRPEPSFADKPEVTDPPAPEPDDMILGFGEAMTWEDNVALSVSAPAPFTPTEYAAGNTQAHQMVFTLVLTNNSTVALEPSVYATVSSGGVEASSIFDYENPVGALEGGPNTAILPGQTVQWLEAYSIADPASITFQVAPSFEYENAIFTNIL